MELALSTGLILLAVFPVLLLIGIPISVTIGISSVLSILTALPWENAVFTAAQRIFTGINSFSLLAIPFFVLAGIIMNNGGIAIKLVNFATLLSGKLPGSSCTYKCCREYVIWSNQWIRNSCSGSNWGNNVSATRRSRI